MKTLEPTQTDIRNRIAHLEVMRLTIEDPNSRKEMWETIQHLRSRLIEIKEAA